MHSLPRNGTLSIKTLSPFLYTVAFHVIVCYHILHAIGTSAGHKSKRKTEMDIRHDTLLATQEDNTCHWV